MSGPGTADLLVAGGQVIDGTGRPRRRLDVAVQDGKVVGLGRDLRVRAREVVDATDRLVCPGFIDMHGHSDVSVLDSPDAESKVRQGVTTEVVGNCGYSPFPSGELSAAEMRARLRTILFGDRDWDWTDLPGWEAAVLSSGTALNIVPLVGHSTLRHAVGAVADGPPSGRQLATMQDLLRSCLRDGAFGLSTGLTLAPSSYATTDEIVALATVLREYPGRFYATHARLWSGWHHKGLEEAIEIGTRAGVPVQYSHVQIIDPQAWGSAAALLALVDAARASGVDVLLDLYPYLASGTPLDQWLPQWALEGGADAMLARLRDPVLRGRMADELALGLFGGIPWDWDSVSIARVPDAMADALVGRSVADIARARGIDGIDAMLELILSTDDDVFVTAANRTEADMRTFLAHHTTSIGSDGFAMSMAGAGRHRPHPRSYGTFPRVLGPYVRDEAVLGLEEAVHRMTGLPARRLSLADRGVIAVDAVADLVVFDPDRIGDQATFDDPCQYPMGVELVAVGGTPVVRDGEGTGSRPGRVLRAGASSPRRGRA